MRRTSVSFDHDRHRPWFFLGAAIFWQSVVDYWLAAPEERELSAGWVDWAQEALSKEPANAHKSPPPQHQESQPVKNTR